MISSLSCKLKCVEKFTYHVQINVMNYFYIFILFWVLVASVTFIYLFFVNAPYGRHMQQGWGKSISARAGWVIMESPCVILIIIYGFLIRKRYYGNHLIRFRYYTNNHLVSNNFNKGFTKNIFIFIIYFF